MNSFSSSWVRRTANLIWFALALSALATLPGSAAPITTEPPGPSSRKTPFVITEIMSNPATITVVTNSTTNNLSTEFLEIYNSNPFYEDLSGFRITGDIEYTFPKGFGLAGLTRVVLAKNANEFQAYYNLTNVAVLPYGVSTGTNIINSLSRAGTLRLRNNSGGVVLEVNYANDPPWPVGADGTGHSLVLARPSYGENDPAAWSLSDRVGGSPGVNETYPTDPLRDVVINEILAHTDPPLLDTIELYNHSNVATDLSGCILTDNATTNKFIIPNGTVIPPRGFVVFDQNQLGFALSAAGETVYFWNSDRTRLLDVVQFGAQENGVSFGRWPDGAAEFYRLQTRTFGTNNSNILVSDVVINELMYDPISGDNKDEYVELYNRTASPINLGGWRLRGGVTFTLPPNTVLAADRYLVIAKNVTNLLAKYAQLNATNTLGNYNGALKNSGARVVLTMPDTTDGTNTIHIVVDEVSYRSGGQWPVWAHGGGSSLERRDARANSRLAANWADSDETAKAPWTTINFTGPLALGADAADAIEGGLQGAGECLLDDVQVIYSGTGRVPNPAFTSGATGWAFRGNQARSAIDPTSGFGGGPGLRLRASGRCDTGANRIRAALSTTIPDTATATIQAKARWQRGWPELLLRLHGNALDAPTRLLLPNNLGTPGLVNSAAVANRGPAIYTVAHTPVLPAANQAVVVTARVHDPDGVATVQLRYRVDPAPNYTTVNLEDSGAGGDVIAGDGIFSATIPGQVAGTMVAFILTATDAAAIPATNSFPANAPANSAWPRECLVRFGEPQRASSFGTYHQWFTATAISSWINRPVLSNEGVEGTFVYGNFRAIYNFSSRYAGSPYHQGWTSPLGDCHYSMAMPRDDLLLGTENFNKVHAPGDDPFSDTFLAAEQTAHWVARQLGLPWTYRRFVNMYVNGTLRRDNFLMEDAEVPGGDFLDTYYPDDPDGDLRKVSAWYELSDVPTGVAEIQAINWATLLPFRDASGQHRPARYRWNWQGRSYSSTANEFTNLFRLTDAANTPAGAAFQANLEAEADVEQWLRLWAARHACGDWDFFGSQYSQNSYAYRPQKGRWQLFAWDMNTVFKPVTGAFSTTTPFAPGMGLFPPPGTDWSDDSNLTKIFQNPAFRRAYWRAYKELCSGPLAATNFNAYVDSRYNAFVADGLSVMSPNDQYSFTDGNSQEFGTNVNFSGSMKTYAATARSVILGRLAAADVANFTVNGSPTFTTGSNLVTFSGSAPVEIKTITVNGRAYPVTWLTTSAWTLAVPLAAGTNTLVFQAWDVYGDPLTNFSQTITAEYVGAVEIPEGAIGFNEIQPHPLPPGAQFVELFNRATNAFDLSGWRINGLDYTFPGGAFIQPQGYVVLAKDWYAYAETYGFENPPDGLFDGNLDPDGETLTLLRPGAAPGEEIVVDRIRYETKAPWPVTTNGASLQLVDATQDNSRVANWRVATTNPPGFAQWVRVSVTGIPRPTAVARPLFISLQSAGDIYLDDVSVVAGTAPESGANLVTNGGFETSLSPWTIGTVGNNSASVGSTAFRRSGNSSLHLIATAAGNTQNSSIWQDFSTAMTVGATYTLSFWYLPSTNGGPLVVRLSTSGVGSTNNPAPTEILPAKATPGATNSVAATLPPFPPVWLNEVLVTNVSAAFDHFGEREPWTEVFNAGSNEFSLAGYYLTDTYTNLTKWAFPAGATIGATNFLVTWCDAQPEQSTAAAPHTSFRLAGSPGQLALTRITNGGPQIVDYLNHPGVPANWSYGDFPDGQPFYRRAMYRATPGAPNTNTAPPLTVFLNEWLADNLTTLADPADGQFEDWFEIYNPGTNTVDLGGYYLTDNLANKFQFLVPTNGHYTIPPDGFLLVWADNESNQNNTNRADLHASFALSKGGEALGIFAADGTAIDTITFGPQTTDVSQGRFPDGAAGIFTMPTRTPRLPNLIPNTAPVLASLADQFTYAGLTVQVNASATDAESSVQALTFSLLAAPAEATLDPVSGAFSWSVPGRAPPGTNVVTLRVLDNGTPPLSADQEFAVIIRPLPQLSAARVGDQLEITWPATEPGWRLEAQTNTLAAGLGAAWFPVAEAVGTNQLRLPINSENETVFLRLIHP
jgi:hypothetical protein